MERAGHRVDLDLSGLKCPLPVLRTRKALRGLPAGARLVVTTTDPLAGLDIPNLVREEGDRLEAQEQLPAPAHAPAALRFTILRT
ncbi:sulfurtransferase TusA family protein [Methylobacterium sp. A54F]